MKKLSLLLIAALIMLTIAGCKSGSNKPSKSLGDNSTEQNAVEITVITSYGGDDGNRQNYEKAVKAYEASSGNIVDDSSGISNEEWKAVIAEKFENGTEPDILFYFTGVDSNRIVELGKVVSVEEIRSVYADYASNMDDSMLPRSPVDGKSYAIPVNGYWEGLYVNKKVLAECGVDIPDADTSWEQFLEDCQKIADKGYIPIAASLKEVPHYWFEFCIFNNGSAESHLDVPQSFDDAVGQSWVDGLNDIKDLYTRGFFPKNTTTAANVETDVLMTDNKAAFMIDGSWKMGWFAENAADINNFTVTYVPGKGNRKPTDIVGGLSMGYFITRQAWEDPEKQAVCVDFIKAMTSDEVVATFGITAVTALKNDLTPPTDASNLVKDALVMTGNITNIVGAVGDVLLPSARSNLFSDISGIVTGNMSAEEAVNRFLEFKE